MKQTVASVLTIGVLTLTVFQGVQAEEGPSASSQMPSSTTAVMETMQPASAPTNITNVEPPLSEQQSMSSPSDQDQELERGLDTVSLSEEKIGFRGNWVKKREWLLRAKEVNRKIQENVTACTQRRTPFLKEYNAIQSTLDGFYEDIGKRLGKLQAETGIAQAQHEMEEAKAAQISLAQERAIEKSIPTFEEFDKDEDFKKKVLTFNEEITPVKRLDEALTKRIEKLDEELDVVQTEAERGQVLYEEMWEVLDDQKAQTYFYQLKDISAKIKTVREYIENDFAMDFSSIIATTQNQIESVKAKMLELEGTFKALQTLQEQREKERLARQSKNTQSWYIAYPKKVLNAIVSFFSFITKPIRMIFTKKSPAQTQRAQTTRAMS